MFIKKLEILNFKSYFDFYSISPFYNFTSIIGPNGSGKSNLLDAISFVFCVNSSNLRVNRTLEVISKNKENCFVRIYLKNDFVFERSIDKNNVSHFKLNNNFITMKNYIDHLEKLNIFPKIKNFIIYQNIVKLDIDFNKMIEIMSNSIQYKSEYEDLQNKMILANKNLSNKYEKKKDILNDLNEIKDFKNKEINFKKLIEKKDEINKIIYLLKFKLKNNDKTQIEQKLLNLNQEIINIENNEEFIHFSSEINKIKKEIAVLQKEYFEINSELNFKQENNNFNEKIIEIKNYEEVLKNKTKIDYSLLNSDNENIKNSFLNSKNKEENEISLKKAFEDNFNKKKEIYKNSVKDLENDLIKMEIENFQSFNKKEILAETFKKIEFKIKKINSQNENKTKIIKENKEKIKNYEIEYSDLNRKLNKEENYKNLINTIESKEKELNTITREILFNKAKYNENNYNIKIKNIVENLKAINSKVYGRVIDLIKPIQSKYENCISSLLNTFQNSIFVQDEKSALECIRYLKETKAGKLFIIICERLSYTKIKQYHSNLINPKDVVTQKSNSNISEQNFNLLINFVFKNTFIAEDNDKINREYNIVTLNGTLFKRNGLITGGNTLLNKYEENILDDLILQRRNVLENLKELKIQRETFSIYDQIKNKMENIKIEIKKLNEEIELFSVDENVQNDCEVNFYDYENINLNLINDLNLLNEGKNIIHALLNKITEELSFFEKEKNLITEKINKKEIEILFPILNLINIRNLKEYEFKIKEQEKIKEIELKLNLLKKEINFNKEEENKEEEKIKLDLIKTRRENLILFLESKKNLLNSKNNYVKDFLNKKSLLKNKVLNFNIYKNKIEEEISDILKYSELENNLNLKNEEHIEKIEKCIENYKEKSLISFNNLQLEIDKEIAKNIPMNFSNNNSLQNKYYKFNLEYQEAKEDALICKDHFFKIKKLRQERFNECLEFLKENINSIYKKLAYNLNDTDDGKMAYVVNEGDFFSNKLKFYIMPQNKGFVEFKELSGGEKTLAILSFIFALNKFKNSPFYIFDEIDSALDKENLIKLANFIKNIKEERQILIISHKNQLYQYSDALIGIYKCPDENKSKILTYKLE